MVKIKIDVFHQQITWLFWSNTFKARDWYPKELEVQLFFRGVMLGIHQIFGRLGKCLREVRFKTGHAWNPDFWVNFGDRAGVDNLISSPIKVIFLSWLHGSPKRMLLFSFYFLWIFEQRKVIIHFYKLFTGQFLRHPHSSYLIWFEAFSTLQLDDESLEDVERESILPYKNITSGFMTQLILTIQI